MERKTLLVVGVTAVVGVGIVVGVVFFLRARNAPEDATLLISRPTTNGAPSVPGGVAPDVRPFVKPDDIPTSPPYVPGAPVPKGYADETGVITDDGSVQ